MPEEQEILLQSVEEKAAEATRKELDDFKNSLPEYATKEDIESKFSSLEEKVNELGVSELKDTLDTVKSAAEEQGLKLTELIEKSEKVAEKTVEDIIYNKLVEHKDEIAKFKTTSSKSHGVVMDMNAKSTNVVRSDISGDTMAMRVPGVGVLQRRQPFIRELFNSGAVSPNNHGVIRYVDQNSRTEAAAAIAEAAAYAQSDIDWIERNIPIEKYGHYIKVSKEMMDDVDFTATQINTELITGLNLKIDADLLSGSGSTPILKGLATSATAFTAGSYANKVQDAQLYDLISIIGAQIMTGTGYVPNAVLVNQLDAVANMKLKKDGENNYIIPPFVVNTPQGQTLIDGMQLVVNSGVTDNTMYVGDFTKGTVYSSQQLQIELGYENDDFTKGLITVRADERLSLLIRVVDNGAFRKVTSITDALSDIEEVQH